MKKVFALLFFIVTAFAGRGQNLVPNPSFEDYDTCPDFPSQITRASGWFDASPTSDYFNACAPIGMPFTVSVPLNSFGYRTAATGDGYAGIIARLGLTIGYSEVIGVPLTFPLQIGTKYFVSFKVSLAGQINSVNWCGINKIGALFSTVQYNSYLISLCNCAQVFTNTIITDTLNWTGITGSFIADSNYLFVNIGRFFTNSMTDSIQIAGAQCNAYYYIDDVCVSTDSLTCNATTGIESAITNSQSAITISPNPFTDQLIITNKNNEEGEIILYDIAGRVVARTFLPFGEDRWGLQNLTRGMYLYRIVGKNGVMGQGKVVKQ